MLWVKLPPTCAAGTICPTTLPGLLSTVKVPATWPLSTVASTFTSVFRSLGVPLEKAPMSTWASAMSASPRIVLPMSALPLTSMTPLPASAWTAATRCCIVPFTSTCASTSS
jgi:hypothetical protein